MLHITKAQAKLKNVTIVTEKHGNEEVPSVSLALVMALPGQIIDGLDKGIRRTMFRKPLKEEQAQGELNGVEANEGMTKVLFPLLAPLLWNEDFTGYSIIIGSGLISTDTDEKIEDVKLSKIKIEPEDGGAVVLSCSVHFEADGELIGALGVNQGKTIEVSLEPPYIPH